MKQFLQLTLALATTVALAAEPSRKELLDETTRNEIMCELAKPDLLENGFQASAEPSLEGLKKAVLLYSFNPTIAACTFPDVSVRSLPVGEYESLSDAAPHAVTLTGRVEYSWDTYRVQQAVLSVPTGLSATTYINASGQVVIEAVTPVGQP